MFFYCLFLPNDADALLIGIDSLDWKSILLIVLFTLTYIKHEIHMKHELESFDFII